MINDASDIIEGGTRNCSKCELISYFYYFKDTTAFPSFGNLGCDPQSEPVIPWNEHAIMIVLIMKRNI